MLVHSNEGAILAWYPRVKRKKWRKNVFHFSILPNKFTWLKSCWLLCLSLYALAYWNFTSVRMFYLFFLIRHCVQFHSIVASKLALTSLRLLAENVLNEVLGIKKIANMLLELWICLMHLKKIMFFNMLMLFVVCQLKLSTRTFVFNEQNTWYCCGWLLIFH